MRDRKSKMYTSEELLHEINKMKDALLNMPYDIECLSHHELVMKSQELDRLISMYQSLLSS
jgi:Spo0E like sporulation regulatory protein